MIGLIFIHLFISVTCLLTGFLMHTYVLKFLEGSHDEPHKPVIVYLITGLISITAICQWTILFHPLDNSTRFVFFATLILCLLVARRKTIELLREVFTK